jgi:hypothetical protein
LRLRGAGRDKDVYSGVAAIECLPEIGVGVSIRVEISRRDQNVMATADWPNVNRRAALAEVARRAIEHKKEFRTPKAPTALEGVQTEIVNWDAIDRQAR